MSKYKTSYGKFAVNRKNKYASNCGASGGEGKPGFQPGNTCGGDGDGSNTSGDQGGGDHKSNLDERKKIIGGAMENLDPSMTVWDAVSELALADHEDDSIRTAAEAMMDELNYQGVVGQTNPDGSGLQIDQDSILGESGGEIQEFLKDQIADYYFEDDRTANEILADTGAGEGGAPERSSEIIKDHANFASALYGEDFDHEEKVRLRNSLQKAAESGSAEEDMIASVYEETRDMWGEGKAYDDRHKNIVTSMVKELTDPEFSSYMDLSETQKPAAWELLQADTGAGEGGEVESLAEDVGNEIYRTGMPVSSMEELKEFEIPDDQLEAVWNALDPEYKTGAGEGGDLSFPAPLLPSGESEDWQSVELDVSGLSKKNRVDLSEAIGSIASVPQFRYDLENGKLSIELNENVNQPDLDKLQNFIESTKGVEYADTGAGDGGITPEQQSQLAEDALSKLNPTDRQTAEAEIQELRNYSFDSKSDVQEYLDYQYGSPDEGVSPKITDAVWEGIGGERTQGGWVGEDRPAPSATDRFTDSQDYGDWNGETAKTHLNSLMDSELGIAYNEMRDQYDESDMAGGVYSVDDMVSDMFERPARFGSAEEMQKEFEQRAIQAMSEMEDQGIEAPGDYTVMDAEAFVDRTLPMMKALRDWGEGVSGEDITQMDEPLMDIMRDRKQELEDSGVTTGAEKTATAEEQARYNELVESGMSPIEAMDAVAGEGGGATGSGSRSEAFDLYKEDYGDDASEEDFEDSYAGHWEVEKDSMGREIPVGWAKDWVEQIGGVSEAISQDQIQSNTDYDKWNAELDKYNEGYSAKLNPDSGKWEMYDRQDDEFAVLPYEYEYQFEAEDAAKEMNNEMLDENIASGGNQPSDDQPYKEKYFDYQKWTRDLIMGGEISVENGHVFWNR